MNYLKRFEVGTEHTMAKGILKVKSYEEKGDVLYMTYTLNEDPKEYTNKYVNIISNIYKYQKKHGDVVPEAALAEETDSSDINETQTETEQEKEIEHV